VAIAADTRLIPSWVVGRRDDLLAEVFIRDLTDQLETRREPAGLQTETLPD
jgi:hypothetical protein